MMRDTLATRFVLVLSCHGHCHSQSQQTGPQLETWQRARRCGPLLDETQDACDVVVCASAVYLTDIVCFIVCCPREKQITARSTVRYVENEAQVVESDALRGFIRAKSSVAAEHHRGRGSNLEQTCLRSNYKT